MTPGDHLAPGDGDGKRNAAFIITLRCYRGALEKKAE